MNPKMMNLPHPKIVCLLFFFLLLIKSYSQDYLSTQGTTLPGTVMVNDTLKVSGKVSYNFTRVFVQPDNQKTITYLAQDIKSFSLEQGGGSFISIPLGKKGKSGLYERLSPEGMKLYIVTEASSIDRRKNPTQNNTKAKIDYSIYSREDNLVIAGKLSELAEYLKTRCEGLHRAITVYKDKNYSWGLLANEEEILRKYARIIDDYSNNRCTYIAKDY